MTRLKSILLAICTGILGITLGAWVTHKIVMKEHNRYGEILDCIYIQDQVRVLELLGNNENDKAVCKLESRLNTWILTLGPNPGHSKPLSADVKSAFRLAAKHREIHPFTTNSPGVDRMVVFVSPPGGTNPGWSLTDQNQGFLSNLIFMRSGYKHMSTTGLTPRSSGPHRHGQVQPLQLFDFASPSSALPPAGPLNFSR